MIAPTPWAYPTSAPGNAQPFPPVDPYAPPFPPPRRGRNIGVGLAVAAWIVLVAVAGLGAYLLLHNSKSKPDASSNVVVPNDAPAAAGLPPGYTEFVDRADAFRIAVPSAWRQINPSSPGASQAFRQLVESNPRLGAVFGANASSIIARHIKFFTIDLNFRGVSPNVNLTVVPAVGIRDTDLTEQLAGIREGYDRLGITIQHFAPTQVAGHQALQLTVSLGADANPTHSPLTETQYRTWGPTTCSTRSPSRASAPTSARSSRRFAPRKRQSAREKRPRVAPPGSTVRSAVAAAGVTR